MTIEVTDLDALLGAPLQVKLGGQTYKLPPDCPAELYLSMLRIAQADDASTQVADIERVHDGVLDLFQIHQPDMDGLPAAMSLQLMVELIGHVYNQADEPQPDPTPPKPRGGTKSSRSRPKKTASRSSS